MQIFKWLHGSTHEIEGKKDPANTKEDAPDIVNRAIFGEKEANRTDKEQGKCIITQLKTNDEGSHGRTNIGPHDNPDSLTQGQQPRTNQTNCNHCHTWTRLDQSCHPNPN